MPGKAATIAGAAGRAAAFLVFALLILVTVGGAIAVLFAAAVASASTYTVTNTNDSGAGSLRQAVLDANANAGADTIALGAGANTLVDSGGNNTVTAGAGADNITTAGGADTIVGSGAHPAQYEGFQRDARANAEEMRAKGMGAFAARYGRGPARVQLEAKDPRGFAEFLKNLAEHSAAGSANTMQGYQGRRPSLYALVEDIKRIAIPALIIAGDEDDITIETSLMLKRAIATAGLAVFPKTGHAMNLEEPALFNQTLDAFLHQVEAGRWGPRDARSPVASIYGPGGKP